MLRCCFALLLLIDKAAACAAFAAAFNAQPENWTLLDCNIECCTGDNCNNQYVSAVPPTMVYTTTPNPVSPTSESLGRYHAAKNELKRGDMIGYPFITFIYPLEFKAKKAYYKILIRT